MLKFFYKPLDTALEEIKEEYKISEEDMKKLINAILKYIEHIEECYEQLEVGEI